MRELDLASVDAYRDWLESHTAEWVLVQESCRIPISRFYRDRGVFDRLREIVIPALAKSAMERQERTLRIWSAGCASGEEPYTVSIIWIGELSSRFPDLELQIVATDADAHILERARAAVYQSSSLKDLPLLWRDSAFTKEGGRFSLRSEFRRPVEFRLEDIRRTVPPECFDLILCRNLAFTYFDSDLQREVLTRIEARLLPGSALVVGSHESLPAGTCLKPWPGASCIYQSPGRY
jgi:chemotaxis protein methyltransferase CheR